MKSVIEATPIYWMSLAHIPKTVVNKIRKKPFTYLWSRKKEKSSISLVKWKG